LNNSGAGISYYQDAGSSSRINKVETERTIEHVKTLLTFTSSDGVRPAIPARHCHFELSPMNISGLMLMPIVGIRSPEYRIPQEARRNSNTVCTDGLLRAMVALLDVVLVVMVGISLFDDGNTDGFAWKLIRKRGTVGSDGHWIREWPVCLD
jgi:hypothetical protein